MWNFLACMLRIRSATNLFSGTTSTSRMSSVIGEAPSPLRSAITRSFTYTMPTTSSTSSSSFRNTGRRLKPSSTALSRACVMVRSLSINMASGRGTIISRTTVSPNSIIDSMSSRSSCSITLSCAAASTIPKNSCSPMNGPCFSPSPFTMTLVSLINTVDAARNGQKRTSKEIGRAVVVAPRTGLSSAYVFGTASASTKNNITLIITPTATPAGPNNRPDTIPISVACTV